MTKDELQSKYLFTNFEEEFAAKNGIKLVFEVDLFNEHIYWLIKWSENNEEYYKEFNDFNSACDYFLECNVETLHSKE